MVVQNANRFSRSFRYCQSPYNTSNKINGGLHKDRQTVYTDTENRFKQTDKTKYLRWDNNRMFD